MAGSEGSCILPRAVKQGWAAARADLFVAEAVWCGVWDAVRQSEAMRTRQGNLTDGVVPDD